LIIEMRGEENIWSLQLESSNFKHACVVQFLIYSLIKKFNFLMLSPPQVRTIFCSLDHHSGQQEGPLIIFIKRRIASTYQAPRSLREVIIAAPKGN